MTETQTDQAPVDRALEKQLRVLQRVILPVASQLDTTPLYVDAGSAAGPRYDTMNGRTSQQQVVVASTEEANTQDFLSRTSLVVRSGDRLSLGTYFNAFPASYWRRWTDLTSVRLEVQTSGPGTIIVSKSNARGSCSA